MPFALIPSRPPLGRLGRPMVGAGGFEPPVLDPKSSVLPLDDAPTIGSRSCPLLSRCGIVRVDGRGPLAVGRAVGTLGGRAGCAGAAVHEALPVPAQHLRRDL